MNKTECKKLIAVLSRVYPNHFKGFTGQDGDEMAEAWMFVMGDYEYTDASNALKMYIATDDRGFPPSPGQIINKISKFYEPQFPTAMEAWGLVIKAISNGIYNAEKEFNALPPICQRAIGSAESLHEMAMMDTSTVMSVEQSHFIRNYDRMVESEKELAKMPESVRGLVGKVVAQIGAAE